MHETQASIGYFQDKTFPTKTTQSMLEHLKKEILELEDAINNGTYDEMRLEAADCYLLLHGIAHQEKFDLGQAVDEKMVINRTRTWGKPNAKGFTEHVEA